MLQRFVALAWASYALGTVASAYRVAISDTDSLREVCSGMWGGKDASIELSFNPASSGQVALVIYEWKDVQYLGAETPRSGDDDELPKTYICTTSAVRSGLCPSSQLGSFITTLPEGKTLDSTSIYTRALKFSTEDNNDANEEYDDAPAEQPQDDTPEFEDPYANEGEVGQVEDSDNADDVADIADGAFRKRQLGDWLDGITGGAAAQDEDGDEQDQDDTEAQYQDAEENQNEDTEQNGEEIQNVGADLDDGENQDQPQEDDWESLQQRPDDDDDNQGSDDNGEQANDEQTADEPISEEPAEDESANDEPANDEPAQDEPTETLPPEYESDDTVDIPDEVEAGAETETYSGPITYAVPKTGYYCIGIVPVTLVESRSTLDRRQSATHAEYSGMVTFHNVFEGELPAVEYPKIGFYFLLSIVYAALGLGWAFLCFKHRDELLPMQYYISGTIIFLIIEMLANFAYYRYINKHGGGATSLAFLFVISVLNAARNSLSFFLLLIVSMGLSVVRQSLGGVMTKVRILTGLHFVFGVLYSVGTVQVELDSAALVMVMILIFPLALTLTAFLMWIIVSLNGTILFLQAHKQRMKLQMFQRLWRILVMAIIAIAAFFVVSSMSLSNRLDENYAPNNWRYRWILLDGSLALIYLAVFSAVAWIWRPTANNRSFSMSQELAQDEAEADAEDYEIDNLGARTNGHQPLGEDDDEESKPFGRKSGPRGDVGDENTVFALDDSDDEGSDDGKKAKGKAGYRDDDDDEGREGVKEPRLRRDS